ncbi:hypothetical protein JJD84_23150 [Pseudomonas fluorescens]|nr:hypothetical protein [Pseudomonas fluorescens]
MTDIEFDERPELPEEAGSWAVEGFNPNESWLASAPRDLKIEAMRQWFCSRFQDPANDTPYNGREGGYQFIHGGPYDPDDEIQNRFSHLVEHEILEELINSLIAEVGDEWAPSSHMGAVDDWEYDEAISFFNDEKTPFRLLLQKLSDIEDVLEVGGSPHVKTLVTQLAHGATITALETYLLEVALWRALSNEESLRSFIENSEGTELGSQSIKMPDIFKRMDGLKKQVFAHLQKTNWHQLNEAKKTYEKCFGIDFPNTNALKGDVLTRNDIVHRGGKNLDGEEIEVSVEQVNDVTERVRDFAQQLENEFDLKHPSVF